MRSLAKAAPYLIALGFQVSGIQSQPLAFILWGIAAVAATWQFAIWEPIRGRLIHASRMYPMISLISAVAIGVVVGGTEFGLIWYFVGQGKIESTLPLANKISVYERNTYNWDYKGDPNKPTLITSETLFRKRTDGTTGEALLTPLIGNESSSEIVAAGTNFIITIHYTEGTPVEFGPHTIWRPMDHVPRNKQRFTALIDQSIVPGPVKWGPNEMIRAKLPVGKYKVDYFIQGKSEKGEPFTVERSCNIEIYHLPS